MVSVFSWSVRKCQKYAWLTLRDCCERACCACHKHLLARIQSASLSPPRARAWGFSTAEDRVGVRSAASIGRSGAGATRRPRAHPPRQLSSRVGILEPGPPSLWPGWIPYFTVVPGRSRNEEKAGPLPCGASSPLSIFRAVPKIDRGQGKGRKDERG